MRNPDARTIAITNTIRTAIRNTTMNNILVVTADIIAVASLRAWTKLRTWPTEPEGRKKQ
ncbi:unnamed protein product [Fusarium graminearum]|uniref:Uncharacterized protein n=1 Tax=Gibberella zeae TaxID=5518 RepID=A0A4U9EMB6_GIBZA|nr:unnamed protein product [Fusarium graminearum]CAF3664194.1 unnamed protein product [Fusarium graminearum]CAG1959887.1 unnamed protein product [Fusarium graminearum]CAG1964165.1 unnamed protein product [Fusarium graminearum]CAG1974855.1 unnamed protein product [Fusarium graminearum]